MMAGNKMLKDTIILSIMQLMLDSSALFLNSFITSHLGASAIGILSLMGSFLTLAGILSNGNAFLCTNRLISEEIGRKGGNPERVLFHGIKLCIFLSCTVSFFIFVFADEISEKFFSGANMTTAVRFMPCALGAGAVSSCIKGYFNAVRKATFTAVGDITEFAVRAAIIITMTLCADSPDEEDVCRILIISIIAGNIFSLVYLICGYIKFHGRKKGSNPLTFREYVSSAIPIMGGSILTAVLSSTNDAVIPMCLRQYGDSVSDALSLFGIFEAIVIPTLFFPSVVICSMSGITVSESARANSAGNSERLQSLTSRLTGYTLFYAVFAASVLMRFGEKIGIILGGGKLAGDMIEFIAPVVPFIYMEIILEALIKGMGLQKFSSLNYLAEYVIRIAIVLIFVPKTGFYGIALSYYASNIFGNCMRFIKVSSYTKTPFRPLKTIIAPVVYSFLTMNTAELLFKILNIKGEGILFMIIFTILWGLLYGLVFSVINGRCHKKSEKGFGFVKNSQISTKFVS
ncbi:MAG: polysaccharide biosynthesis C-terminal domain-containing protein [Ruminococcus sp.]|nr:polysaccharide biosynthesis C-terminal domain-containing protein [Ruminococcus sp.]